MKPDFTGELRRRMEEAVLLPADHAEYSAVLEAIAQAGDWAAQDWAALHGENELLRARLQAVHPPEGLEARLLAIPTVGAPRSLRMGVPAVLAAAVIVILAVAAAWLPRLSAPAADPAIALVAHRMVEDHLSDPHLTIETSDPAAAAAALESTAPFEFRVVPPAAGAALIGARICSFPEGPLILTRWRRDDHQVSVYQIRLADFGVPPNLPPREIVPAGTSGAAATCRVTLWTDDRFIHAVVRDAGDGGS
jgi:hypothetical protein